MAQIIRLECTTGGHNKFYEMTENGDGTFTARYGAIGTSGATKTYPMSKWPSIYNEKIRNRYRGNCSPKLIEDLLGFSSRRKSATICAAAAPQRPPPTRWAL